MNIDPSFPSPTPRVTSVDAWRQTIATVFDGLTLQEAGDRDGFHAHLALGGHRILRTAAIAATRQQVTRRTGCARNGPGDELVLMLQQSGSCEIEQAGNRSRLGPGDLVLFDNARPYTLAMKDRFEQRLVRIERAWWGPLVPQLERRCAQRLGHSAALRFLGSMVRNLTDETTEDTGELDVFAPAIVDIAACALVGQPQRRHGSDALYQRVVGSIRQRLWDATLDPASLASEHGISVRYLHRLFSTQGESVMGFVREARLVACARALRAGPGVPVLSRVAERFGFADDATFRRAFRRRFGVAPGVYARAG